MTPYHSQYWAHSLIMDEIEGRWLSVDNICKYLGVSKDTVYKWIDRGGMPAHRVGRLWKFMKAKFDYWVRGGGARSPRNRNKRTSPLKMEFDIDGDQEI